MLKPGRHRFVRLQDLVAYQSRQGERTRAAVDELVGLSEGADLYAKTDGPAPTTR